MKKIYKREFERNDKRHLLLFGYEEHKEIAYKELEANFNKPRVIPFLGKNRLSYQSDILERWYGDKRHVEEVKIARRQLINAWYEYLPKFQSWIKIQITKVDRLLAKTS